MKKLSHKDRGELAFFVNPETKKVEYFLLLT